MKPQKREIIKFIICVRLFFFPLRIIGIIWQKKNTNIFVGLNFKYHMKLSTSEILYLERLTQNTRILKFNNSSIVN